MFLVSPVFHHIRWIQKSHFSVLEETLKFGQMICAVHLMPLNCTNMCRNFTHTCTIGEHSNAIMIQFGEVICTVKRSIPFSLLFMLFHVKSLLILICHIFSWFPLLANPEIAKLICCVNLFDGIVSLVWRIRVLLHVKRVLPLLYLFLYLHVPHSKPKTSGCSLEPTSIN